MSTLTTARTINAACYTACHSGGPTVFADLPGADRARVTGARTRRGTLQVRVLATGAWTPARSVYTD